MAGAPAAAARQIKALIGASAGKVESGRALVQQAGSRVDGIVVDIRRVSPEIGLIGVIGAFRLPGAAA